MKIYRGLWDQDLSEESTKPPEHEQEVKGQEVRQEEWAGQDDEEP